MSLTVTLPEEVEARIRRKVDAGLYASVDQAVCEALTLLDQRETAAEERLESLRRDIDAGLSDADAGRLVDGNVVFQRLQRLIDGQGSS